MLGLLEILSAFFSDCRFDLAKLVGQARRYMGEDLLLSIWVYLDDLDTEKNVIYVRVKVFSCKGFD